MTPRPVERREIDAVGRALARAFQDDPAFAWIYPDEARRRAIGPLYYAVATALTLPEGRTYTTPGEPLGAACFLPPHVRHVPIMRAVRAAGFSSWRFGLQGLRRAHALMTALEPIHPEGPHWYLMTLGVDPAAQGKGVGRLLVSTVLAEADSRGEDVYLETFKEGNVAYYERLGFEVRQEVRPDGGRGPRGWTMLRAAVRAGG